MMSPEDDFWQSIGSEATNEIESQKGDFPVTGSEVNPTNYEILPIQELRKRAEKLNVIDWETLNKQKLIDEIRNHIK